ncbi:MAG: serine/threonine-protein kinase [Myxococcota bacterium]
MDDEPASDPAPRRPDSGLGLSGRVALAATVQAVSGEAPPPDRLGGYAVTRRLGRGAFGDVYLGRDLELERDVALKLLRDPTATDATARLRKEAQAMAALAHPALLTVYGLDQHEGRVFIAMEYAERGTLRDWLQAAPRSTEAIVSQLILAARGLHAAHVAGFVHRDVKPSNILIGADGRARVSDFGLVFSGPSVTMMSDEGSDGTETALGGTPPYMAPELFDGAAPSTRTDAFALGITLYEALFEARPKARHLARTHPPIPTRRTRPDGPVPQWLHDVLARALQTDPARRHDSLDALADDLERGLGQRARRTRLGASVLVVSFAVGMGWAASASGTADPCTGAAESLAGIWDAPTAQALEASVLSRPEPFAAASWKSVRAGLDAYASAWTEAHTEACRATSVRGERSADMLDAAMVCLDDRKRNLAAFVDVLEAGSAQTLAKAPVAAAALPSLGPCSDLDQLQSATPRPPEASRASIEALEDAVAHADALRRTGSARAAQARLDEIAEAVDASDYAPLQQRARFARASAASALGDGAAEVSALLAAYGVAARMGRRTDTLEAARRVAVALAWDEDHEAGARWLELAKASSDPADPAQRRATLALSTSSVLLLAGDVDRSVTAGRAAVAQMEAAVGPEGLRLVDALRPLAHALAERDEFEEAAGLYNRAYRIVEASVGADHPLAAEVRLAQASQACEREDHEVCTTLATSVLDVYEAAFGPEALRLCDPLTLLGNAAYDRGELEAAHALLSRANAIAAADANAASNTSRLPTLAGLSEVALARGDIETSARHAEAAVDLARAALPADHPRLARPLSNLARVRSRQGDHARALTLTETVDTLLVRSFGPDSPERILPLGVQCEALLYLERPADAMAVARTQLRLIQSTYGEDDPFAAMPQYNLGFAAEALNDLDAAQRFYEASLDLLEGAGDPEAVELTYPLTGLARAYVGAKRPSEALAPLERALTLANGQPQMVADAQVVLVEALLASGGDRVRARKLADEAAVTLRQLGGPSLETLDELNTLRNAYEL